MAGAVSRIDPTAQDQPRPASPATAGAAVPFLFSVSWNSLTASLLPVHIGVGGLERKAAEWDESSAESDVPARWAMVVPKMDREASGDPK